MKTTVIYTAAFFILCLTGMKCKKTILEPKQELPTETMEGKRTFGCLVNGNIWLFRDKFPYSGLTTVIQFEILSLSASRGNEYIHFGLRGVDKVGEYRLIAVDNSVTYIIENDQYDCIEGILTVKHFDKIKKIISGTFHFKAKNKNGKMVNIENGRFDVKYTD